MDVNFSLNLFNLDGKWADSHLICVYSKVICYSTSKSRISKVTIYCISILSYPLNQYHLQIDGPWVVGPWDSLNLDHLGVQLFPKSQQERKARVPTESLIMFIVVWKLSVLHILADQGHHCPLVGALWSPLVVGYDVSIVSSISRSPSVTLCCRWRHQSQWKRRASQIEQQPLQTACS